MRSDPYTVICQTAEAGQPLLEEPGCLHGRAYQLQCLGIGFLLRRVALVIPPLPDEKAAMGINGYVRRKLLRQAQKTTAVIPVVVTERHGSDPPEVDTQLLRVPQAGVPLPRRRTAGGYLLPPGRRTGRIPPQGRGTERRFLIRQSASWQTLLLVSCLKNGGNAGASPPFLYGLGNY